MSHIRTKQGGFAVITMMVAAVALMGIITAVVSMSRTSTATASDLARPYASAVISQGYNLAQAFANLEAKGVLPTKITYGLCGNGSCTGSTAPGSNDLLNSAVSSLALQTPPVQAFATGAAKPFWILKSSTTVSTNGVGGTLAVNGVGLQTTADYAFVLADLDITVCQQINQQLFNSTTIFSPPTAGLTFNTLTGSATAPFTSPGPTEATASDLQSTGTTVPSGTMQGCAKTSDATPHYFYYVVAEPQ